MFLTKGIQATEAERRLPQYLAKCSDSETRPAAMRMVRHLARVAWKSRGSWVAHSQSWHVPTLNVEIAMEFAETILKYREYELFGEAMGWFKKVEPKLFALVKVATTEGSFDFGQVKDR